MKHGAPKRPTGTVPLKHPLAPPFSGTVAWWPGDDGGSRVLDHSGNGNDLIVSGATASAGPTGAVRYYDGSDDYLHQEVLDTEQGTLYASMVNGAAFIIDEGADFTPWAGGSGATPHMIVLTDDAGKRAWGYLGECAETLGSELVTNGDFSAWTGDNPDSWGVHGESLPNVEISEVGSGEAHGGTGTGSLNFYTTGGNLWINQDGIFTRGKLYKIVVDVSQLSAGTLYIYVSGLGVAASITSAGTYTLYYRWPVSSTSFIIDKGTTPLDATIDSVSVKEVTEYHGSELFSNGDFSAWTGDDPDDWTIDGTEDAGSYVTENPAGQCQIVSDGDTMGILQNVTAANKLYRVVVTVKTVTSGALYVYASSIGNVGTLVAGFNHVCYTAAGAGATIVRLTACNVTVDDASIKQVTAPATMQGVKVYSSRNGSTQNWTGIDSGFDPNNIAGYEVRRADLNLTGAQSIGCWVAAESDATTNIIMSKWENTNRRTFRITDTVGNYSVNASDDGAALMGTNVGAGSASDGEWHLVVSVFRPSASLDIFYDGSLGSQDTTSIAATLYDTHAPFVLGTYYVNGNKVQNFPGQIGEAWVVNRALSAEEIAEYYRANAWRYGRPA